jgi:putative OPT family oligopeptide transporter
VASGELRAEFSIKSVSLGIVFGIVFGAANAYLGLVAGLTISTSIPVAVMTVAAFRFLRGFGRKGDILEANISQTIGSASSSLASGIIFTLPALFLWKLDPELLQMVLLAICGGMIGVLLSTASFRTRKARLVPRCWSPAKSVGTGPLICSGASASGPFISSWSMAFI